MLGLEICGVTHPIKRNGRTMMTILMMIKIMMMTMVLKGNTFSVTERGGSYIKESLYGMCKRYKFDYKRETSNLYQ